MDCRINYHNSIDEVHPADDWHWFIKKLPLLGTATVVLETVLRLLVQFGVVAINATLEILFIKNTCLFTGVPNILDDRYCNLTKVDKARKSTTFRGPGNTFS